MTDFSESEDKLERQREMKEMRGVGPGSRGGPGARQRRNGGQPLTRRPTAKELQHQIDLTHVIVDRNARDNSPEIREKVAALLSKYELTTDVEMGARTFCDAIGTSTQRASVRHANKRYLKAFIYGLAVFEWITGSGNLEEYDAIIREKLGLGTRSYDLLTAVFSLAIDYIDGEEEDRHALSRDVQAARWLISQGIRSFAVKAYQKLPGGGGVDKWSRLASKTATLEAKKPTLRSMPVKCCVSRLSRKSLGMRIT